MLSEIITWDVPLCAEFLICTVWLWYVFNRAKVRYAWRESCAEFCTEKAATAVPRQKRGYTTASGTGP